MSFELQQTIRNNAQQVKEYVNDLYDWEREMEIKEQIKNKQKQTHKKDRDMHEEEIRNKKIQQETIAMQKERVEQVERKKQMMRDVNTVSDYYKAWDKYNPDEQLKRLEEQQKRAYRPYNPYEDSKNNLRAKPKSQIVVKGSRNIVKDPTSLKDKGNVHFKVCEYDRAISCYSECISKVLNQEDVSAPNNRKLLALVYSNRAMAHMKNNDRGQALIDCNQSLKYDPEYSKTYLRRADCLKRLGKYRDSLADYKMVKKLTPGQAEVDIQIRKLEQIIKSRIKQTQQSMIVPPPPKGLSSGFRVEIEEVDEFQKEQSHAVSEQTVNYLEQL